MNGSIWPIDRTLPGTITLGQSGPESKGNEGVLHIHPISGLESDYQIQVYIIPITHLREIRWDKINWWHK